MIPDKIFGRTGHKSKRVISGAVAFLEATQDEADTTMEISLKHGINHIDAADFNKLSDICNQRNVAIQTTKALARGHLGDQEKVRTVWYDPIENESAIEHSVHWVLGNPDVFLNSVGDTYLLPKVLEAASHFHQRPSDEVMQQDIKENNMTPLFTEQSEP